MHYVLAIIIIAAIGYAIYRNRASFGGSGSTGTGTPHEPRDDLPGDKR